MHAHCSIACWVKNVYLSFRMCRSDYRDITDFYVNVILQFYSSLTLQYISSFWRQLAMRKEMKLSLFVEFWTLYVPLHMHICIGIRLNQPIWRHQQEADLQLVSKANETCTLQNKNFTSIMLFHLIPRIQASFRLSRWYCVWIFSWLVVLHI